MWSRCLISGTRGYETKAQKSTGVLLQGLCVLWKHSLSITCGSTAKSNFCLSQKHSKPNPWWNLKCEILNEYKNKPKTQQAVILYRKARGVGHLLSTGEGGGIILLTPLIPCSLCPICHMVQCCPAQLQWPDKSGTGFPLLLQMLLGRGKEQEGISIPLTPLAPLPPTPAPQIGVALPLPSSCKQAGVVKSFLATTKTFGERGFWHPLIVGAQGRCLAWP